MKNTTLFCTLLGIAACGLSFSCKKDKNEPEALKPSAERILGVWNVINEIEKSYVYETGAFKDSSGITLPPGTFTLDFRTDGKVYIKIKRETTTDYDTAAYHMVSEQQLHIDDDTYNLIKFTNTELTTSHWYDDGSSDVENQLVMRK